MLLSLLTINFEMFWQVSVLNAADYQYDFLNDHCDDLYIVSLCALQTNYN